MRVLINFREISAEVILIFCGVYAYLSIFYIIFDAAISLVVFIFTGNLKSFLSEAFKDASLMCPTFPFCILSWEPRSPLSGLNLILKSILSAQYSLGGRVVGFFASASLFVLVFSASLVLNWDIFVKTNRLSNIIHHLAILSVAALFIPTIVAFFGGVMLGIVGVIGWF